MQRLLVEGCAGKLDGCTLAASRAPADRRSQLRAAKVKQPRQWRGRAASPVRVAVAHWASPDPLPHSKVGVSSASPYLRGAPMCHDKQCNPHVMHTLLGADSFRLAGGCRTACAPSHNTSKAKAAPRTRTAHTVLPPVQQAWPAWTKPRTPSGRLERCPRALTPEAQRSMRVRQSSVQARDDARPSPLARVPLS